MGCGQEAHIESPHGIQWVGAMSRVMHKGELNAVISFDKINQKPLYGIGPTQGLEGEIMILDGVSYVSSVVSDSEMHVEVKEAKAPFFVFALIKDWQEYSLPDSIRTLADLNHYLDHWSMEAGKPFFFRIKGAADSAQIHIVNLSKGSIVKSPQDAHKDMKHFQLHHQEVELLGVYSREHAGIFVHHDSPTHIHLITEDKSQMGHLESISLKEGARIYFPLGIRSISL